MPQRTAGSANRRSGSLVRARARVSPETAQTTVPTQDSRRWQKLLTRSQRKPLSTLLLPGRVAPDPTAKFECGCISGHGKWCRSLTHCAFPLHFPTLGLTQKHPLIRLARPLLFCRDWAQRRPEAHTCRSCRRVHGEWAQGLVENCAVVVTGTTAGAIYYCYCKKHRHSTKLLPPTPQRPK